MELHDVSRAASRYHERRRVGFLLRLVIRGDVAANLDLQEPVFRSERPEDEWFAPPAGADDGGGGVKSHRRVKGLRKPFYREQVVLPEIRHVCDTFQRQLTRWTPEVP